MWSWAPWLGRRLCRRTVRLRLWSRLPRARRSRRPSGGRGGRLWWSRRCRRSSWIPGSRWRIRSGIAGLPYGRRRDPIRGRCRSGSCRGTICRGLIWSARHGRGYRLWPAGSRAGRVCGTIWRAAIFRAAAKSRRTVCRRPIAPVASIAGPGIPRDWTRTIPDARRSIRSRPSPPVRVVVVRAACAPIPSPTAPSPRLVAGQQCGQADTGSKGKQRSRNH